MKIFLKCIQKIKLITNNHKGSLNSETHQRDWKFIQIKWRFIPEILGNYNECKVRFNQILRCNYENQVPGHTTFIKWSLVTRTLGQLRIVTLSNCHNSKFGPAKEVELENRYVTSCRYQRENGTWPGMRIRYTQYNYRMSRIMTFLYTIRFLIRDSGDVTGTLIDPRWAPSVD